MSKEYRKALEVGFLPVDTEEEVFHNETMKPYEIEIVSLGAGKNVHRKLRVASPKERFRFNGFVTDDISPYLFIKKRNVFQRFYDKKRYGIKHKFMVVYDMKSKGTVKLEKPKEKEITSNILHIAEHSSALSTAFKGMFASAFTSKKVLFIVIVMVIVFIAILVQTGVIDLGMLGL